MRQFTFEGTPARIGEAFGEALRGEIAELYDLRLRNALAQAKEYGGRSVGEDTLLLVSRRCLPASEAYDPEGYSELAGIARGSGLSLERIFALNGLTDLRDVLAFGDMKAWAPVQSEEGCSSFLVQRDRTADGHLYLGQTWDLATDNMPFVIAVRRKPTGRPATWSMTTAGCMSLIGMNDEGVAIGTTNIRTTDSRIGVTYLQIIHRALREPGLSGVREAIVSAPRAGAHYYYAASAREDGIAVECTATRAVVTQVERGLAVHCNHVLDAESRSLEASTPMHSSLCRQARLSALIGGVGGPVDAALLRGFLADHEGGDLAICRHDFGGISSNGSIVMCPATRRIWVCHGPACTGTWIELAR